ncbi:hypothetical protein V1294_006281 [Bradyrhizobium sp. AZCC 1678]|uniref:hypothetical protein n=1 Tax=Bradyrhizobium sp. AZCC 1678 TaxID=3117030 RepID=UPI002FF0D5D2
MVELPNFPIAKIKVDTEFVAGCAESHLKQIVRRQNVPHPAERKSCGNMPLFGSEGPRQSRMMANNMRDSEANRDAACRLGADKEASPANYCPTPAQVRSQWLAQVSSPSQSPSAGRHGANHRCAGAIEAREPAYVGFCE